MARQIKKPTPAERNRKTQERIRKKEIEPPPSTTGGGGSVYCSVGFSASTDIKPKKRCWPFNTIVFNVGGFTINTAYVSGGNTGTAIQVPADGVYQFGIAGELDFSLVNPVTTPADFTLMSGINSIDVIASGASNFSIVSHRFIQQAIYGNSQWIWLTDFDEIFGIVSEPVALKAGDPIFTSLNFDGTFTANSMTAVGGAGTDWAVEMWVVRLT